MDLSIDDVKAKIVALFNAGKDFESAKARLARLAPVAAQSPELRARYDDIMARGNGLASVISTALQKVRDVYQWVRENIGINIGVLPLVPIAILGGVIAATAAAVAWNNEANNEARRLEIIASLPPEKKAAALANPDSITGNLSKVAMYAAIAVVAVVILKGMRK